VIGFIFGFIAALADVAPPEPLRAEAAGGGLPAGLYVAGVAATAAAVVLGVVLVRRRKRRG
jgi:hypothetical protein